MANDNQRDEKLDKLIEVVDSLAKELRRSNERADARLTRLENQLQAVEVAQKESNRRQEAFDLRQREFDLRQREFEKQLKAFDLRQREFDLRQREFEKRLDAFDLRQTEFEKQLKVLDLRQREFDLRQREFEKQLKAFDLRQREFDLRQREFEKRLDAFDLRQTEFEKQLKAFENQLQAFDYKLQALGARWGTQSENSFRNAVANLLEDVGFIVRKYRKKDADGVVHGHPCDIEIDVAISNGRTYLIEIKSAIDRYDIYRFDRIIKFYESNENRKADRKMIVSPFVTEMTIETADELGIQVCTNPQHAS